ncbi:MAG: energy transducer TonB [Pyrinomonadaceae bacterium]|nr:energy transducer TonB [Pyrinomonadaceae bacterium]
MKNNPCESALIVVSLFFFASIAYGQKVAVIVPEKSETAQNFADKLETSLSAKFRVPDASMSETAFRSIEVENVFNQTIEEAKTIGTAIGCDYFLLVKAQDQRRVSLAKGEYFESFAPVYVVSARTGRLVFWKMQTFEAVRQSDANKLLLASTDELANELAGKLKHVSRAESNEKIPAKIAEVPPENSPEAKDFRPPLPFRRVKPPYTKLADLYRIAATVDILVDVDEKGTIIRTEIVRWAGFGLDEAVDETVRQMNWRAAEKNGRFIPMRVLLRYNFKKLEKEEQ